MNTDTQKDTGVSARAWQHYESVGAELVSYFKQYMQSWTILGTGVLVGAIFGVKIDIGGAPGEVGEAASSIGGVYLCAIPGVLLVWLLLTSWFWARFSMYRHYLSRMEAQLEDPKPALYSAYVNHWFTSIRAKCVTVTACLVAFLVYLVFAVPAARYLAGVLKADIWIFELGYAVIGAVSLLISYWFVTTKAPCHNPLSF